MAKKSLLEDPIFQTLVAAIAAMVARLANLKNAGAYEQALAEIDQRLDELIGLKYDQIRYLGDGFLLDLVTVNDFLDVQRLWFTAALIEARGEIQAARGQHQQALADRSRALGFFIEVSFSADELIAEVEEKIQAIADALWQELPEEILFSLYDLWERRGRYAHALTALDQLLEVTASDPDLVRERQDFLLRLSKKTSAALQEGGLTNDQVNAARNG
jgi:tetratricopeptide (TPR) repeat protein